MLKMGIPVAAAQQKMRLENLDASVLEKDPNEMIPVEGSSVVSTMIALSEHPKYAAYFSMLRVGMPKDTVLEKMRSEGLDPAILDREPTEMVELTLNKPPPPPGPPKAVEAKKPKPRKKKLFWTAISEDDIGEGSLWFDDSADDFELNIDEDEFNQLFVEQLLELGRDETRPVSKMDQIKKKATTLVDAKRAQNGSIALSRLEKSLSIQDIKLRVEFMDCSTFPFTIEQLKSMQMYLPEPLEMKVIRRFAADGGDISSLGVCERFMHAMMDAKGAAKRLSCMMLKVQFKQRVLDIRADMKLTEEACDDVKMSPGLRKVLKVILKVINQLNDGQAKAGFRMDTLLKLSNTKAFDKKTSILQYIVKLLGRSDASSLQFPTELGHVPAAENMDTTAIGKDIDELERDLKKSVDEDLAALEKMTSTDAADSPGARGIESMRAFLEKAQGVLAETRAAFDVAHGKFEGVLKYFGEPSSVKSNELFHTLQLFTQEFQKAKDDYDALVRMEERRRAKEEEGERNPAQKPTRRGTVATMAPGARINMSEILKPPIKLKKPKKKKGTENTKNGEEAKAVAAAPLTGDGRSMLMEMIKGREGGKAKESTGKRDESPLAKPALKRKPSGRRASMV
jgi:hypothetical protein